MKKHIHHTVLLLSLLIGFSCSDFLTEESETNFTTNTLFNTPEGLDKMVVALYRYERSVVTAGNANGFLAAHLWGERLTDLALFTTGDDAALCRYTDPSPTNNNINTLCYNTLWSRRYYMIGRTNEIIYYGAKLGDAATYPVAEASFWRAYCYYGLYSRFSRLYLSTRPVTRDNIGDMNFVPAHRDSVFALMYSDLDRAIRGLPLTVEKKNTGRIGRAAARHMKALVAAWDQNWSEVALQVDSIEIENTHSMEPTNASIFNRSNLLESSESLLTLNFDKERGGGSGHRLGSQFISIGFEMIYTHQMVNGVLQRYNTENLGRNWGLVFPNSYLMSLYPANDKRLSAYYKTHYTYQNPNALITIPVREKKTTPAAAGGMEYWTTSNDGTTPYTVKIGDTIVGRDLPAAGRAKVDRRQILPSSIKYADLWTKPIDTDGGSSSFKDIMIFRLSESFLLGAEAYFHLGNQGKAQYYYNKTWVRAGNDPVSNVTFDMIRDENARELAFEGRRWDFLKRNGIWFEQMKSYAGDFTKWPGSTLTDFNRTSYGVSDGRDPRFAPKAEYYIDFNGSDNDVLVRFNVKPIHVNWPIPQTQIDAMGPGFPQTEGYN